MLIFLDYVFSKHEYATQNQLTITVAFCGCGNGVQMFNIKQSSVNVAFGLPFCQQTIGWEFFKVPTNKCTFYCF